MKWQKKGIYIQMNIFYLDEDPKTCAEAHCDKHVVKMILEYAQILSTAHRVIDFETSWHDSLYKKTHINHPSTKWARETDKNYIWLHLLWVHLCQEYTHRYLKTHKTWSRLKDYLNKEPQNIISGGFSEPPQCMPIELKEKTSVLAYRNYYITSKRSFASWKNRSIPSWFK